MIERTYHCVGGDHSIDKMMPNLGFTLVPLEEANFVVFSGGQDIDPAIYNQKKHPHTHFTPDRDAFELRAYEQAKKDAIKIGICRGGQLLNALNGGILYQDVDHHHGNHVVQYIPKDGPAEFHSINSIHHQMMKPTVDAEVWAVAEESTYRDTEETRRTVLDYDKDGPDPEVLWYGRTRSLCFQAHPEYDPTRTRTLFVKCLQRAILEVQAEETPITKTGTGLVEGSEAGNDCKLPPS